ncbi:MAG TPA: hypothetical protein VGI80_08530 [Pyrinomonadaceae bacterium]|jgi:hypothetical protein
MSIRAIVICIFFLLPNCVVAQHRKRAHPEGQTTFAAETRVKRLVRIPGTIRRRISLEYKDAPGRVGFMKELVASHVFLDNNKSPELLVQGPLGANVTTFRLYRNSRGQWQEMFKDSALGLSIDRHLTRGYNDIGTAAATAVELFGAEYKFNGRKYVATTCYKEPLGVEKPKRTYFKCSE